MFSPNNFLGKAFGGDYKPVHDNECEEKMKQLLDGLGEIADRNSKPTQEMMTFILENLDSEKCSKEIEFLFQTIMRMTMNKAGAPAMKVVFDMLKMGQRRNAIELVDELQKMNAEKQRQWYIANREKMEKERQLLNRHSKEQMQLV